MTELQLEASLRSHPLGTEYRKREAVSFDMGKRKMESDAASSTILSRRRSLWVGPVFPPVDVPLPSPRGALQRSPLKCWIRDPASRCLRKRRAPWDGARLVEPR